VQSRFANGECISGLKKCRSFETWGAWHRTQFMTAASIRRWAELVKGGVQEARLRRQVRLVACQAVFADRIVDSFLLHSLVQGFVTGETEVGALRDQQRIETGLVGVVAARALAGIRRLVPALRGRHLLRDVVVAFHADDPLGVGQHAGMGAGVRVVTGEAVTVFERPVQGRRLDLLHEVLVARDAQIRVGSLEEAGLGRAVPGMTANAIAADHRGVRVRLNELPLQLHVT
jgi:hypothetical protein